MEYRIVADSSCDLNEELKEKLNIGLVPLKINIGEKHFVDDESLDVKELLFDMKNSLEPLRTSCPSPMDFIKEYEKADNIFVVTLSSQLSNTYNNAILAKKMVLESKEKFIHVFDSLSASIGETLVSMKIAELIEAKCNNSDIVEKVEDYIKKMKTYFILESLNNLVKAGRINKVKAKIASILSITPIMGSDENGDIKLVQKVRGRKKAFSRLVEIIGEEVLNQEEKILGIAHCNAPEKAKSLKEKIQKKYNFKDVIIVETGGLSTAYADDGGIIISC